MVANTLCSQEDDGLFIGHAYTLINVHLLEFEGEIHRLVCLRNPHADDKGWVKDWNDEDPRWKRVK